MFYIIFAFFSPLQISLLVDFVEDIIIGGEYLPYAPSADPFRYMQYYRYLKTI